MLRVIVQKGKRTAICIGLLFLAACSPTIPAEELAGTYMAATQEFTSAVADAVGTGIAATIEAQPTNTATSAPTKTSTPTSTASSTMTLTPEPTQTLIPTETGTPEPTVTATPSAATIKTNQLYQSLRDMEYYAEMIYTGLGGTGLTLISCSRELRDSIVTNLDNVRALPTYDDTLLSSRAIGANINYNLARNTLLESADLTANYDWCVTWLDAGKPEDFEWNGSDLQAAIQAANQAIQLAEAGINN